MDIITLIEYANWNVIWREVNRWMRSKEFDTLKNGTFPTTKLYYRIRDAKDAKTLYSH